MKKNLNIMAMIAVMIIIAGSSAYGQIIGNTCANAVPPAKGCVGTCSAVLWNGNNQVPAATLTFGCEKIKGKCKCVAYMPGPQCRVQQNGKCGGSCPPLSLAPGGPAIQGDCVNTGTAANPVCGCKYVLN